MNDEKCLAPPPEERCSTTALAHASIFAAIAGAGAPTAVALRGGGGEAHLAPLTYGGLAAFGARAGAALYACAAYDASRGEPPRLATLLRNSAAAAVAFVCLAERWTLAPPSAFALAPARPPPFAGAPASLDTVALLLHTSGTTSKPKLVPLTHGRVLAGATSIGATLDLRPDDACVNVMPLFHIHGLSVNILATLLRGASVACELALDPARFLDLARGRTAAPPASWYSAVPTLHFALAHVAEPGGPLHDGAPLPRLEVARSCSAALPPSLSERLEAALAPAKALPTYAMTESMPICSSTAPRRGGRYDDAALAAVGFAAGPDVAVPSDPNVAAFVRGGAGERCWLRTGDRGLLEPGGGRGPRLRLVGRSKEIVNRGGEKISPLAVEDVLLRHAAVREVACFAAPRAQLGEVVGARRPRGRPPVDARGFTALRLGVEALDQLRAATPVSFDVGPDAFLDAATPVSLRSSAPAFFAAAAASSGKRDADSSPEAVDDSMALFAKGGGPAGPPKPSAAAMQGHVYFVAMLGILLTHGSLPLDHIASPARPRNWAGMRQLRANIGAGYGIALFFAVAGAGDARNFERHGRRERQTAREVLKPLAVVGAMILLDASSHVVYESLRRNFGWGWAEAQKAPWPLRPNLNRTKWSPSRPSAAWRSRAAASACSTTSGSRRGYFFGPCLLPAGALTPACSAFGDDAAAGVTFEVDPFLLRCAG
ncbi:ligase [Aureococcus anophagefferens]|nr:ligase [Aureococcus anophagefferens]